MDWVVYAALICGALGVAYSLITAGWVFKQDAGNAADAGDLRLRGRRRYGVPDSPVQGRGYYCGYSVRHPLG